MKFKSGFVSLVGRPNVGKSTLINALAREKVAITSNKPQTTRNVIRAVVTDNDSQIVLVDTPGIHRPRTKLGEFMVKCACETITDVDVILLVIDATDTRARSEEQGIIEKIRDCGAPVVLVINKIDAIAKEELLPIIKTYSELMDFHSVIPVAAIKSEGVESIIKVIKANLCEGPKYFPDDALTDQPERVIVGELIREKILHNLNDEIPHGIGIEIMSFKERENKDIVDIQVNIYCEKDSHKAIIIGKQGKMLKKIGSSARFEIERFLSTKVFLELWVKVKEDWRNSDFMLKNLGYRQDS